MFLRTKHHRIVRALLKAVSGLSLDFARFESPSPPGTEEGGESRASQLERNFGDLPSQNRFLFKEVGNL